MTLGPTGVLAGTPTQTGDYYIQPIITDSAGYILNGYSVELLITPPLTAPPLVSYPPIGLGDLAVGVPVRDDLFELDQYIDTGTPPYTWAVTPGSWLPPGLALLAGSNGISTYLGGTPTTTGFYNFSLVAGD